jgi:hypothetical protein
VGAGRRRTSDSGLRWRSVTAHQCGSRNHRRRPRAQWPKKEEGATSRRRSLRRPHRDPCATSRSCWTVKSEGGERTALAAGRDTGQWRRWLLRRRWARPDEDTSGQRRRSVGARHEQAITAMGTDVVDKPTNSHGVRLIYVGSG